MLGKEWFEAVSEKLSVKDIATKMKFVMEESAGMDSSMQLAVEMI